MAFVPEAALIALREGLEALLITGILLGLVTKLGRPDARKHVWAGFAAAAVASVVAGVVVQRFILDAFEERGAGEWFELVAALSAVVVLTYMVFWMWKHTRELMTHVRERVAAALTSGALFTIAFLTFASVIREGLEVVLFYGALASRAAPIDLAWSGFLGFLASALIVSALLGGVWRVDLQKFFAVTGILLVFIAAGLLVHSVMAATALGFLAPAPAIWDTSASIPDDGVAGRVLHATLGYTATPTLLQTILYFGYVLGVGGAYLYGLGAFHTRRAGDRRVAPPRAAAAALAALLVVAAVGWGAANPGALVEGHSHGGSGAAGEPLAIPEGETVGILLRNHGEPVHYNETTYRSFADFVRNLLIMFDYEELLLVDQGTVLLDKSRPFAKGFHADAQLMDAWTRDHPGPALYVGSPVPAAREAQVPFFDGFYLAPGGPGSGEPDILEMAGLGAYQSWLQMEGASPMHHDKLAVLEAAEAILRERYGDRVVIRSSYHILPRVSGGESDLHAARAFAEAGVTRVVDAYTSAIHSDVMNECMMKPHLQHAFGEAGLRVPVVHAGPSGVTAALARGVAEKVRDELARYPADARVAMFLTHHGANPEARSPCKDRSEPYNAQAARMFEMAEAAIAETVPGEGYRVFGVYGQGAGRPEDGVLSPLEAVEAAREWGATHVLDVPYELPGNGFDNLVAHRANYGLKPEDAPHYDANYETHLTAKGLPVRIVSSAFGVDARARAIVGVIEEALSSGLDEPHPGNGH